MHRYSTKHTGVLVFSGNSKWQVPLSSVMVSCTAGCFCQKERQPNLSKSTCMLGHLLRHFPTVRTQKAREKRCGSALQLFMLHHEPVRPWWVPGVVNQHCPPDPSFPITEIPGDSFVFAEKNHGREQPVSAWQSNVPGSQDICMLGILAWNYSSRQQRVFSGECRSQSWLLQEPECGQQNILSVQHIAQML